MAEKAFNSLMHLPDAKFDNHFDSEDLSTFAHVLTQLEKHQKANEVLRKIIAFKE